MLNHIDLSLLLRSSNSSMQLLKPPEVDSGAWDSLPLELKKEVVREYEEREKHEAVGLDRRRIRGEMPIARLRMAGDQKEVSGSQREARVLLRQVCEEVYGGKEEATHQELEAAMGQAAQ